LCSEDRALQFLLSSGLEREFQVILEPEGHSVARPFSAAEFDAAILDLNSNRESSQARVERFRHIIAAQIPAIVLAEERLWPAASELVREGAYCCCPRPPSIPDLKVMLRTAHEGALSGSQYQSAKESRETESSCDGMIGASPQMLQVYQLARSVTNINASVLVTGESGTGKELIARAIHNLGARANRPFVAVACGAIPETLIEAELFGHEKGAFTGTVGAREGYFEQVGDGTLLLDEIGELSLYTQVKLLRVLQQREFSRLGSSRLLTLQARLIFATHQDLSAMVAKGRFRQDLYYRINVVRIEAPPLREHAEDIPHLAVHFLRHYARVYQKPKETIEPQALSLLQAYPWPGNVRELENVIQRAIVLSTGKAIRSEVLPPNLRQDNIVDIASYRPPGSFGRKLHDYKVNLAETAVRENHGNMAQAARSLCISRGYLYRLLSIAKPAPAFECRSQEVEFAEVGPPESEALEMP
jgi:DNA-binding NtrC family response regulator